MMENKLSTMKTHLDTHVKVKVKDNINALNCEPKWQPITGASVNPLTPQGLNQILQFCTKYLFHIFPGVKKMFEIQIAFQLHYFLSKFHWSLFQKVQLMIVISKSGNGLKL